VQTGPKAADLAMQAGRTLYTDSARRSRVSTGEEPDAVHHPKKEYARGDVQEHRAACLFSLLQPSVRVFRGISKTNLPGSGGFLHCRRNLPPLTAGAQAEMLLYAA
jgi:hypothetical protein